MTTPRDFLQVMQQPVVNNVQAVPSTVLPGCLGVACLVVLCQARRGLPLQLLSGVDHGAYLPCRRTQVVEAAKS